MLKDRIRFIRKQFGLSQLEFAEKLEFSQNYIWMLENGKRAPGSRAITSICHTFNIERNWLEFGEGEPFRPDEDVENNEVDNSIPKMILALTKTYEDFDKKEKEVLLRFVKTFVDNLKQ